MNDIIQNLEANATNGRENFCYISEKQLNAMKELSKREAKENKQLKDNWNKLKKDLELVVDYGLGDESSKWDKIYGEHAKSTLKFMQELEQGSDVED